jgi:hypothetical protein
MLPGALAVNMIFIYLLIRMFSNWIKLRYKNKMYQGLMEKFSSSQEFTEFVNTQGGNDFINTFPIEEPEIKEKLLSSINRGIITTIVGASLILIGFVYKEYAMEFSIFGIAVTALGLGFLISAGISLRISRKWDLLE